jgi:hypothetical protein
MKVATKKSLIKMLKNVFSKIANYTISFGIILSIFEAYPAQALSLTFNQNGFPGNGFLRGEFHGEDRDNNGSVDFNIESIYLGDETDDRGYVVIEYLSDNSERIYLDSRFTIGDYFFRYSISSNQLIGYLDGLYNGVSISERRTCFFSIIFGEECSNSPLVIQSLPNNNNSGNNSSTTVPEASLVAGLASFSLAVLLKRNKKSCFK